MFVSAVAIRAILDEGAHWFYESSAFNIFTHKCSAPANIFVTVMQVNECAQISCTKRVEHKAPLQLFYPVCIAKRINTIQVQNQIRDLKEKKTMRIDAIFFPEKQTSNRTCLS
jgi:hypothetical protein